MIEVSTVERSAAAARSVGRGLAPYGREAAPVLAGVVLAGAALIGCGRVWGLVLIVAMLAVFAVPGPARRGLVGWMRCARSRRLMLAGLGAVRMANTRGQLPRVRRVRATPFGERVELRTRPGHSAELLTIRMEELRAACKAATVRIDRDPTRSHRITVDVVRRDPLACTPVVAWADRDRERLSLWDPIHLGLTEWGEQRRLSLVERGAIVAGLPGSGKSSLLNLVVSHASRGPAQLWLIDPNGVQFGPWKARATAYAAQDPADAIALLDALRDEVDRRLTLLESLPGVQRKVTPEIAAEHGLHPLLLAIDELAYHTATVGTPQQQQRFAMTARDLVSRGRAALLIAVMATQRPTQDVVPRALSGLFGLRVAFRTANNADSDVVLGEGMAAAGYNAADIPIEARGVALVLGEGGKPEKVRVSWVPDEAIAELAVTTVSNRPTRTSAAGATR